MANQNTANLPNPQKVEKVTLEEYSQWLLNPVTKAFLATLHNQSLKLNQLTSLPVPLDLGQVLERRTQAMVLSVTANLSGVKESICHPEKEAK